MVTRMEECCKTQTLLEGSTAFLINLPFAVRLKLCSCLSERICLRFCNQLKALNLAIVSARPGRVSYDGRL